MLSIALVHGQPAKSSIEGTVQNARNGEPIAGARVTLDANTVAATNVAVPANALVPVASTDGQGRFVLRDVDPGQYRLVVQSNGFTRTEYGQKIFPGKGTPIRLVAGEERKDISIALQPTGVISGRIFDSNGNPVPGVPVQLAQSVYDAQGQHFLNMRFTTVSNDRGEYRFYYITPGAYIVGAGVLSGDPSSAIASFAAQQFGHVYYPAVNNVDQATPVEIRPGAELNGIDMRVPSGSGSYSIRGRLIDSRTGAPPPSANFSLNYRSVSRGGVMGMVTSEFPYDPKTGAFSYSRVSPGTYGVTATFQDAPAQGAAGARSVGASYAASAIVRVVDSDVEGVLLRTPDTFSIGGQVNFEGPRPSQGVALVRIEPASNDPDELLFRQPSSVSSSPDGTFTVTRLVAGEYRVSVQLGLLPGAYVKDARFGNADVWNQHLILSGATDSKLEVTVSMKSAQIEGTVVDAKGQPAEPNPVVLVPEHNRERTDLFRIGTVDRAGHFIIENVAPGEYKLFAWEALEPFAYFDPALLTRYDEQASRIHLAESGREHADVKIIPVYSSNP
jgi:hypothetical protein